MNKDKHNNNKLNKLENRIKITIRKNRQIKKQ